MNSKINRQQVAILAFVLVMIYSSLVFGQKTDKPQHLSPNKPLEHQIKGGEMQQFQFETKKGADTLTEVEQKNIDVIVLLKSGRR